jgi:hypothetical protein
MKNKTIALLLLLFAALVGIVLAVPTSLIPPQALPPLSEHENPKPQTRRENTGKQDTLSRIYVKRG